MDLLGLPFTISKSKLPEPRPAATGFLLMPRAVGLVSSMLKFNPEVMAGPITSNSDKTIDKSNFKEMLFMDKIKPLTIRFKASRNDIVSFATNTDFQNVKNNNLIHDLKRNIVSLTKTQTAMGLDTTISISAFVKQSFKIKTEMKFGNGEFFTSYDIVDAGVNRDSVLLIKF
jgi:hypothetical protein